MSIDNIIYIYACVCVSINSLFSIVNCKVAKRQQGVVQKKHEGTRHSPKNRSTWWFNDDQTIATIYILGVILISNKPHTIYKVHMCMCIHIIYMCVCACVCTHNHHEIWNLPLSFDSIPCQVHTFERQSWSWDWPHGWSVHAPPGQRTPTLEDSPPWYQ